MCLFSPLYHGIMSDTVHGLLCSLYRDVFGDMLGKGSILISDLYALLKKPCQACFSHLTLNSFHNAVS